MQNKVPPRHVKKQQPPLSLHPLTPDQALAAALKVKPEDMAKQERAAKRAKRRKR